MPKYKDFSGRSGVAAYEIDGPTIIITFKDGGRYLYDPTAPGTEHVKAMRALARAGEGLATYINKHVREHYAKRLDTPR